MPSVDITVDVDVQVWCGICGSGICKYSEVEWDSRSIKVTAYCWTCEQKMKKLEDEVKEGEEDEEEES